MSSVSLAGSGPNERIRKSPRSTKIILPVLEVMSFLIDSRTIDNAEGIHVARMYVARYIRVARRPETEWKVREARR